MHDYYARYLPQMALAVSVPLLIVVAIFPSNWAAALILLGTAPLIPLFMALVGMGAADANRRNFLALARLSGHFLDRLRGMETLRILVVVKLKLKVFVLLRKISVNGQWKCYGWRFYPPAFSNFYLAVDCSGGGLLWFSYLGELDFGHYDTGVTLAAGFLA